MKGKFDKGKLPASAKAEYYKDGRDPNYNKNQQVEPTRRMGQGSFANLPDEPIMKAYSSSHNYRSGVVNDYSCGIEDESDIHENRP